jgi:hypothetical protein
MLGGNTAYNNVVTAGSLNHVGDELGGYRSSTFVLLVLASIWKKGNNRGNPLCTCYFACVDHYTEFHKRCVHGATSGVDNVDIILANRLNDANVSFTDCIASNLGSRDRQPKAEARA